MKPRSCRLAVEMLEDRTVPSSLGDFNNDGLVDVAELTNPRTITVRLANPDNTYTVSATLKVPKSLPIHQLAVVDVNADGNLDIVANSFNGPGRHPSHYVHTWLGNGDGTFGSRDTESVFGGL
jgi:hypothetical protein